jgi:hypothetical protein
MIPNNSERGMATAILVSARDAYVFNDGGQFPSVRDATEEESVFPNDRLRFGVGGNPNEVVGAAQTIPQIKI